MSHQPPQPPVPLHWSVYSIKFLCGEFRLDPAAEKQGRPGPVKPGNYATAINIHNPNPWHEISFNKKAVLLFNASDPSFTGDPEQPREPGPAFHVKLGPDYGMEIDCSDIRSHLLEGRVDPTAFIKGWVVLEGLMGWPLDVVAVYTAHTFIDEKPEGFSIATERVPGVSVPISWPFFPMH